MDSASDFDSEYLGSIPSRPDEKKGIDMTEREIICK